MANSLNDAATIEINLAERVRRSAKTKWANKLGNPDEREAQFIVNLEGLTPKDFVETLADQVLIKFRSRVNASGIGYHEFRTNANAGKYAGVSIGDGNTIFLSPSVWAKQERTQDLAAKTLKLINTPDQARNAASVAMTQGKIMLFTQANGRQPNDAEISAIHEEVRGIIDSMFVAAASAPAVQTEPQQ